MPKLSEMMESRFMKKGDVGDDGMVLTISDILKLNVAPQDAEPEEKWCVRFREFPKKPMVLNSTNKLALAEVLGSDDTDDWIDKRVVVYNEPNVSFGPKRTGGLRIRGIKKAKPAIPAQPIREPGEDLDEAAELEPVV